jgi:hypothetical protein
MGISGLAGNRLRCTRAWDGFQRSPFTFQQSCWLGLSGDMNRLAFFVVHERDVSASRSAYN